jgi:D-serine deaminase-like pyridoxal phosphate-dependent protein
VTSLSDLLTPALVLDRPKAEANARRLRATLAGRGVTLRPHVKTVKNADIVRMAFDGGRGPITASTLAEAEHFFEAGFTDVLYAVGLAPVKLPRAEALVRRGCSLKVILDSPAAAETLRDFCSSRGVRIPALVEIDTDGHRAGVRPDDPALLEIGRRLDTPAGSLLAGVMTHAGGGSYSSSTTQEIAEWAERERSLTVEAATRLRAAGLAADTVSVGSTPTALFGRSFEGVTEVRAGVYLFFDLVMVGLGVCTTDEIAISALVSVIGHQAAKGWLITDGGWMALAQDRGTAKQAVDQGYGQVCDVAGQPIEDLVVIATNQEHGMVARRSGGSLDMTRFPVGTRLRVLPIHACATAAQYDRYHVVGGDTSGDQRVVAEWPRVGGW